MLLAFMLVLTCTAPALAEQATPAQTEQTEPAQTTQTTPAQGEQTEPAGAHSIVEKTYTFYIGKTADDTLNQEFPLYFIDGVDDLPYVEITDWAKLLYFINTDMNGDPGYGLDVHYQDDAVVLERENSYTLAFDFVNDRLVFLDYDGFMHNSNDTALIDLVSEAGTDENGNAELIWRDRKSSFDRYGDEMTVDLAANGIHMVYQDEGCYVPLQTLNDFTLLPSLIGVVFNGQALFLANDNLFYDYSVGDYTEVAEIYYDAPTGDRSDALAEYSYNELCPEIHHRLLL